MLKNGSEMGYSSNTSAPLAEFPPNSTPCDEIDPVEITSRLNEDFPFSMGDIFGHFNLARSFPPDYFAGMRAVRDKAREFAERVIKPRAVEIDRRVGREPEYFAWDVIKAACPYGFYSMLIPRQFGGRGAYALHMSVMAEELAVGCAGLASTIGVHSAGISCGMISLDPFILEKFIRPVAEAEKRGEPILWSGAVTEPAAGTDIWDEEFLDKARVVTIARKVSGGYILNGRKCFISNGNVAKISVVAAALNPENIRESWSAFLVPTDSKGYSIGRVERKMGQKASPAAELIFEDVFVPSSQLIGQEGMGARYVSIYLAGSRGPVGAIGVGCARRALECLVEWAKVKKNRRGRLIDQQAVQQTIARMAGEIVAARRMYMASAMACDQFFSSIIDRPSVQAMLTLLPGKFVMSETGRRLLQSRAVKKVAKSFLAAAAPEDRLAVVSSLAAMAKCKGSEVGVDVAGEAARVMGPDCMDPRWPVEKAWRDAKLTQIYEGTNQANAITAFKGMAATWKGRR